MQVSCDAVSQQIFVIIPHQVPDPAPRCVREVVAPINGRETATVQYTSQPSPSSFTFTYPVDDPSGSIVAVSAHCSP